MLAATRILALAVCAVMLIGCNRVTEVKLLGTWRAEDDQTVEEMACRKDHSFTSWTSWKNELTTPSVGIGAGDWQLQGHELVVHFTKYVPVDTWANEDKQIRFTIVKIRNDALLMKNFDGSKVLTYKRLLPDYVLTLIQRPPSDADFVGTWQIHYNTHDYEERFGADHSAVTSFRLEGRAEEAATALWRIDGHDLIMDVKTDSNGPVEHRTIRWEVTGIQPQRIAIKDGPVPYILERLK